MPSDFAHSKREKVKEALVRTEAITADVTRPHQSGLTHYITSWRIDKLPPFNLWVADLMRMDPQIKFGLSVRNGPLFAADCVVSGDNEKVTAFVQEQWDKIWNTSSHKLLRTRVYGYMGYEVMYQYDKKGFVIFKRLKDLHPSMVRPMTHKHNNVVQGMVVRPHGSFGAYHSLVDEPRTKRDPHRVLAPKCLWTTFEGRFENPFGEPILQHCYPSWWEKWMEHGAKRQTVLRMLKDSWIGDVIFYPPNYAFTNKDGEKISARDLLREVSENRLSGASLMLPMVYDAKSGKELFRYQPPTTIPGETPIFDWMERLNIEMWKGLDIPKEVIEAAGTGSGFSGRSIPFVAFVTLLMCEFQEIVTAVNEMILRPLVALNFGVQPDYEIKPMEVDQLVQKITGGSSLAAIAGSGVGMGGGQPGGMPMRFSMTDDESRLIERIKRGHSPSSEDRRQLAELKLRELTSEITHGIPSLDDVSVANFAEFAEQFSDEDPDGNKRRGEHWVSEHKRDGNEVDGYWRTNPGETKRREERGRKFDRPEKIEGLEIQKPPAPRSKEKSPARQRVEAALTPELRDRLTLRASRLLGADIRQQYDPEDIAQEAISEALRDADKLPDDADLEGWLMTVVQHTAQDKGRGARAIKRGRGKGKFSLDQEIDVAEELAAQMGLDPETIIGKALRSMPEEDARIIDLTYGLSDPDKKYTSQEIARKLRIKGKDAAAAIRKRLERARAALREHIDAQYGQLDEAPLRDTTQDPGGKLGGATAGKHAPPEGMREKRIRRRLAGYGGPKGKPAEEADRDSWGDVEGEDAHQEHHRKPAEKVDFERLRTRQFEIEPQTGSAKFRANDEDDDYWNLIDESVNVRHQTEDQGRRAQDLWEIQGDPRERAKKLGIRLNIHPDTPAPEWHAHAALDEIERLHNHFNLPAAARTNVSIRPIWERGTLAAYRPTQGGRAMRLAPAQSQSELRHTEEPSIRNAWAVDSSYEGNVAHEHGHAVHYSLPHWQRALWSAIYRSEQAASKYGAQDEMEGFAEAFSAYVHPNYQRGTLPDAIERFFDVVISKEHAGRIPPATPVTVADQAEAERRERERWGMLATLVGSMGGAALMGGRGIGIGGAAVVLGFPWVQKLLRRFRSMPPEMQERLAMRAFRDKDVNPDTLTDFFEELEKHASERDPKAVQSARERPKGKTSAGGQKSRLSRKQNLKVQSQQFDDDSADPTADNLIDLASRAAAAASTEARQAILDFLQKKKSLDDPALLNRIEEAFKQIQPTLAEILKQSSLAGVVRGADDVLELVPPAAPGITAEPPPPFVPSGRELLFPEGQQPIVRFPVLESAARRLVEKRIVSPEEFEALNDSAKQDAFSIAAQLTNDSLVAIQKVLAENVYRGADIRQFVRDVGGLFEEGMSLSKRHLEMVFRNQVNTAYSNGHDKALSHPLIADALPYRAYTATQDQRVRDEHLYLEHAGLDGTNVYHSQDRVFQTFMPPWDFNCRCSWHPMTITQAARRGVSHAKRWLEEAAKAGTPAEFYQFPAEHVPWPTLNGKRIEPPAGWTRREL